MLNPTLIKSVKNNYLPHHFKEELLDKVSFKVHKFNNRKRPDSSRTTLICCFSEFGCETLGVLYCIPRILKQHLGRYVIAVGWSGRAYLYKHLVDEYWELDEKYMSLRDRTYAFHFVSKNLFAIEEKIKQYGKVVPSADVGGFLVGNYCRMCGKLWSDAVERVENCPNCQGTTIVRSILTNVKETKKQVCMLPKPKEKALEWAKQQITGKTVAVFARNRKTYARNLTYNFYLKIQDLLTKSGYNIVWLGEKNNSFPAPENTIDLVGLNDLEKTLAIISLCDFTIQFFTASSRFAGMMGTPFILFENPELFYPYSFEKASSGQEGKRLELCTFGKRKIVLCDYVMLAENEEAGITILDRAIKELTSSNEEDIIGLVPNVELVKEMKKVYDECI